MTPPEGLVVVPLGKSCWLLLTPSEFAAGIRRGKWWRRREALVARTAPLLTSPHVPDTPQEA